MGEELWTGGASSLKNAHGAESHSETGHFQLRELSSVLENHLQSVHDLLKNKDMYCTDWHKKLSIIPLLLCAGEIQTEQVSKGTAWGPCRKTLVTGPLPELLPGQAASEVGKLAESPAEGWRGGPSGLSGRTPGRVGTLADMGWLP